MNNWTMCKPTMEGWYFWRSRKTCTDPWKWEAVFLMDQEDGTLESWIGGTACWMPRGGWWKKIVHEGQTQ